MSVRLEIEQLRVTVDGRTLLDVDDLRVGAGSLVVIAGDAGSGKTLLAAALCGDIDAGGQVRLDGRLLNGPPSRRRSAGLAASVRDGQRITGCTVREALRLAARGGARSNEALEQLSQLATRADVPAQFLSGGEQQILQIACAWCTTPRVLVLDSPTVGLAADAAASVTALAVEEAAGGTTVMWFEQDRRAAPVEPVAALVKGRLPATSVSAEAPSAPVTGPRRELG